MGFRGLGWAAGAALAIALLGAPALAKGARCFTTDDGYYDCNFRGTDSAGSFSIWADGYPTYSIEIYRTNRAYGYADFGSGNKSLPGEYVRNRNDRACWDNTETDAQICAW